MQFGSYNQVVEAVAPAPSSYNTTTTTASAVERIKNHQRVCYVKQANIILQHQMIPREEEEEAEKN